jgi:aryl-alcohol dehydrogenase
MKIKAAFIYKKGDQFTLEEADLQQPSDNEVLVKITSCGVCHTDDVARHQQIPVQLPAVLGHEGSGIIESVGKNVTEFVPGDHVVLSFATCGICENCLSGKSYMCEKFNSINFGGTLKDGTSRISKDGKSVSTFFGQSTFATYAVADASNVVKVDKDVDLTLLGPLGCGIQTGAGTVLNALKPEFGSTLVVFGCGSVGISAIMAANIANCSKIIAVDIVQDKLDLALELGATHIINSLETEQFVGEIKAITNGGAHYAIETTGLGMLINKGLYSLRPLGTMAIVGVAGEVSIDIFNALMSEGKTMMGVIEGNSIPKVFIPQLIEYYKAGKFPFDKLIKFYDFEQINTAFEDSKKGNVIKPVFKI